MHSVARQEEEENPAVENPTSNVLILFHAGENGDGSMMPIGLPLTYQNLRTLFYGCGRRGWSLASKALRMGLDPDEVFQDILLGLVSRARASSGFDPARGYAPTTYAWMVMQCVIRNQGRSRLSPKYELFDLGVEQDQALNLHDLWERD